MSVWKGLCRECRENVGKLSVQCREALSRGALMTRATCTDCGSRFDRDPAESWKTRCYTCWKKTKATTSTLGETGLRYELHEALIEAAQLRARLREAERRGVIPPDMLKRLIALAHPDRHGGSKIATEATQWLLSQREASR